MLKIEVENLKATLNNIFTPLNISLLSGKNTEVKPGVFVQLVGNLDFSVKPLNAGNLEIVFKIEPRVTVQKFITLHGTLTSVLITKNGIELRIDGIPDVYLEAIS